MSSFYSNLSNTVIIFLLVLLFLEQCNSKNNKPLIIKRDTAYVTHDTIVYLKPQLIKTIPVNYKSTEYIPDTNYKKLVIQYNNLVNKFLETNIYKDSVKIDSIGHVLIKDTISNNLLKNRSIAYNIKYPKIIEYVPEKKRNQIYYGAGFGLANSNIESINVGGILKTKKDNIWGLNIGVNSNKNIVYGIQSYWKISFRKDK